MLLSVADILGVLIGAIVGGIATFIASYALEIRKWQANAAIDRKDTIYSPVYDKLVSMQITLETPEWWFRHMRIFLDKWLELKDKSSVFTVPNALRQRLDSFADLCERYEASSGGLYQQMQLAFPDTHFQWQDYGIGNLLAQKMLAFPQADNDVVIKHLRQHNPTFPDELVDYWTKDRLEETRLKIQALEAWPHLSQLHNEYHQELLAVKSDLAQRIQRVVEIYQRADPKL